MPKYLVASTFADEQLTSVVADNQEQAVHAYCSDHGYVSRVVVIHGDSATVYAVNEIKSLSVVRLGGY